MTTQANLILREDVEQHVAVDQSADSHQGCRVSAMISSVLSRTSPRPRRRFTMSRPRFDPPSTLRTTIASSALSKVTSVPAPMPNASRCSFSYAELARLLAERCGHGCGMLGG